MLATWWSLCGALALTAIAEGASYDPLLDLEAYPEFQRGLRRYRQHHLRHNQRHHHHPHKMALAHHYAVQWSPDEAPTPMLKWSPDDDNVQAKPAGAGMLPGRHKAVEKALEGMSGDLDNLKEKQLAAKEQRGQLEGSVKEVVRHMNDAMSIKHAVQKKEAEIRRERLKLEGLEHEAKHIEETHASLVASLHRVLEPKLMFARSRLERKELTLAKEEQAVKVWQEKKEQIHARALELLAEKKKFHQEEAQAEQDVSEAKKREEVAHNRYREARQRTGQEIQSFRYAETRVKAEITHKEAAEEATTAAKDSVKKLGEVLQVESEKVEESMEATKNQIRHRMEKIDGYREKSEKELVALKQRYRDWQENQRLRAAEVVHKAEDTAIAAEAYADRQKQVLDTAQSKVVHDAEAKASAAAQDAKEAEPKSDWAWDGGSFSNDDNEGFSDSTPSFSD